MRRAALRFSLLAPLRPVTPAARCLPALVLPLTRVSAQRSYSAFPSPDPPGSRPSGYAGKPSEATLEEDDDEDADEEESEEAKQDLGYQRHKLDEKWYYTPFQMEASHKLTPEEAAAAVAKMAPEKVEQHLEDAKRADPTASPGVVEARILAKIRHTFVDATHISILNESSKHNVPKGSETHFKVVIVWPYFQDVPLIARHREVNKTLALELLAPPRGAGVHALSIVAKTPAEWDAMNRIVQPSPNCAGGSKR